MVALLVNLPFSRDDACFSPARTGADHLYSTAALTNSAGAVVERYGYDAYGKRVTLNPDGSAKTGNAATVVGFTGRTLDGESGLWYFRARYFSDSLNRFIGRDAIASLSESIYSEWHLSGKKLLDNENYNNQKIQSSINPYMGEFIGNKLDPYGYAASTWDIEAAQCAAGVEIAFGACIARAMAMPDPRAALAAVIVCTGVKAFMLSLCYYTWQQKEFNKACLAVAMSSNCTKFNPVGQGLCMACGGNNECPKGRESTILVNDSAPGEARPGDAKCTVTVKYNSACCEQCPKDWIRIVRSPG